MSTEPTGRLVDLADLIGSRHDVDWAHELESSSSVAEAKVVDSMRVLAKIRDLHAARSADLPRSWGRLELGDELGRGSYGSVLRARDPQLERDVALKLLHEDRVEGDEERERILHEGRCLARVQHPNVVAVHGVEEHGGRIGLWMEYVEGRTLAEMIQGDGPLSEGEARAIGETLARAVAAVHAEGVVHRDIKAQNVMRAGGGRVVLMDFGAGSRRGELSGPAIGTPMYLAPELIDGQPASPRSDLFALGVLLFHLVTGEYPVRATSLGELRRAHETRDLRSLSDLRPELSADFVSIVERCLASDPEGRYDGAGSLAHALAGSTELRTAPHAAQPPRSGRAASGMPRRTLLLASAAVTVLATIAAFGVATLFTPAGPIEADAAIFRGTASGREELAAGATLRAGDEVGLRFRADDELHVYVLNQDDRGQTYLLYPLPWLDQQNPLPAGSEHRLPGSVGGEARLWGVDGSATRERILVTASRDPLPELEAMLASLTPAQRADEAPGLALDATTTESTGRRLRGMGQLVRPSQERQGDGGAAFDLFESLANVPARNDELWVRRFEFAGAPR